MILPGVIIRTLESGDNYMEMVSILMGFIHADQKGNCKLHLEPFAKMLK